MKKLKLFIVPLLAFTIAIGGAFAGSLGSNDSRQNDVREFTNTTQQCGNECTLLDEGCEAIPLTTGRIACECELMDEQIVDAAIQPGLFCQQLTKPIDQVN